MSVSLTAAVTDTLHTDEDSAAIALFLRLLRRSPLLRQWLWREFAVSPATRERCRDYLRAAEIPPVPVGPKLLAWLAGEHDAYLDERAALQTRFRDRITTNIYGGLNRTQLEALIRRYQAGQRDYGVFLLLYLWRKQLAGKFAGEWRLLLASELFWTLAAQEPDVTSAKQFLRAQSYFAERAEPLLRRADYGFSDWWKISVLLYMLNHPKPRYRTGEFRRHLDAERLRVDPKDIRAFCKQHGIARDSRSGRPRRNVA